MRCEFSTALKKAILARATEPGGRVHCERCGEWCKTRKHYEIDHVLAEGLRSDHDRKRKLVAADGQLLCIPCHKKKTPYDKSAIALAKRQEAYSLGLEKPGKKKLPTRKREEHGEPKRALGPTALARRGFVPAGRP